MISLILKIIETLFICALGFVMIYWLIMLGVGFFLFIKYLPIEIKIWKVRFDIFFDKHIRSKFKK